MTSARRTVLKLLATAPVAAHVARATPAAAAEPTPGIVKPLPPELFTVRGSNAETRFAALRGTGYHTPVDRFFVRNHTSTPLLDARTWSLTVWGSGLRGGPRRFSYRELRALPSVVHDVALECAGNGRNFFTTQQHDTVTGTPWTLGAVGVARWRGVRLAEVLRRAGIGGHAVDVMPRGLDAEYVAGGVSKGRVRRPLPVAKALDDVILAYEMNGAPLPHDHGFPVRVVVPAWVGIASIKWLGDIEVSAEPLYSPWNTEFYRLFGSAYPADGGTPLTVRNVRSAFELDHGSVFAAHRIHHLTGRSWSGLAPVTRVDVSTDGGTHWHQARLEDLPRRNGWVRWSFPWRPRTTGPAELLARATDAAGNTQPDRTVPNTQGFLFDAVVRVPVTVG
ncbi:sulfite oxidase [Streptomyces zagrosensis]|uniref:DMSO/TMAO reductase YedYZ molybdopterin-dependent catalytic subunit n=1 Tax=Streptomyces zagrosensis TaxID=1042984 RepID=A0A7W9Q9S2_9ACTN|nr:sulfite oxidase [Streptomyces zagrosensis]MBB5936260.1 DMSO/TMAO reductase YedYZ molybdopterin-dependent catalytic subunit [Streptomyces zagrosensis]